MAHNLMSYAAYLPSNMLDRGVLADALGGTRGSGNRSVAGFDEDSLTMAVSAAARLEDVRVNAPLLFATAHPPYADKTNATVARAALGWGERRLTVDLAGLRSGVASLIMAAALGGVAIMGDRSGGRSGSLAETDGGDAGAAFSFGEGDDPVASVRGSASASAELMDLWRSPAMNHAQLAEERFSQHVLAREMKDVVAAVRREAGSDGLPTFTLVSALQSRFALRSAAAIGAEPRFDILTSHRSEIGYCGAADVGVLLARALDSAKAGDTILVVNAVGSIDAVMLEVLRDGPGIIGSTADLARRRPVSYVEFLTWSGRLQREPARRPEKASVAAAPASRNADWKYALTGGRCENCGKVYLPVHRICGQCGATDTQTPYSVARRTGVIAAVSTDGVTDSPAPPNVAAVIDFDGGGRLTMELADVPAAAPRLGDVVEPVFRRTYESSGVPNYFWKARRVREQDDE